MRHNNSSETGFAHVPVMQGEVLEYIAEVSDTDKGFVVDCTTGEGGHSELILKNFPNMRIIGIERDRDILECAKKRLEIFEERIEFVNDNFSNLSTCLKNKEGRISVFLYDFGISNYHYERSGRGFSISRDEVLDMRLDSMGGVDAYHVVNNDSESELQEIFHKFGEERFAKRIAGYICRRRKEKKIETTGELAELILKAIPRRFHVKNIHPATRVFQAIRIAVNGELTSIEKSLKDACKFLTPGGRIIAISFHSLEDRIVKNRFRRMARGCICEADPEYCQCELKPFVKILTKKPVTPKQDEISGNKKARSAKLRVCEKIE